MFQVISVSLFVSILLTSCSKGTKNAESEDDGPGVTIIDTIPFASLPQTQATFSLGANDEFVNVMGSVRPALPSFGEVRKKSGFLRGYVKNIWGKPLAGAFIGVRSSAVGGAYTTASDVTDAKGYYEIEPPFGAVQIYAAGFTLNYAGSVVAQGLYPADGAVESVSSSEGSVENFVLLSYGTGPASAIAEKPYYSRNYFGGAIRISYTIYEDMWSPPGSLPANAEIEITLTPDEFLLDATERKSFIIRKKVGNLNFNINNIPVGRYKIKAKLVNGNGLKLKETSFWPHPVLGMNPKQAVETATITFIPHSADLNATVPYLGGWNDLGIKLEVQ